MSLQRCTALAPLSLRSLQRSPLVSVCRTATNTHIHSHPSLQPQNALIARAFASGQDKDDGPTPPQEKHKLLRKELQSMNRLSSQAAATGGKPYSTPTTVCAPSIAHYIPNSAIDAVTVTGKPLRLPQMCRGKVTLLSVCENVTSLKHSNEWLDAAYENMPFPRAAAAGDNAALFASPAKQAVADTSISPADLQAFQLNIISNPIVAFLFGSYFSRRIAAAIPAYRRDFTAVLRGSPFDKSKSTWVLPSSTDSNRTRSALASSSSSTASATASSAPLRDALHAEPGFSCWNTAVHHLMLIDAEGRIRWRATGAPEEYELRILKQCVRALVEEKRRAEHK